jgi:hypothetical protein
MSDIGSSSSDRLADRPKSVQLSIEKGVDSHQPRNRASRAHPTLGSFADFAIVSMYAESFDCVTNGQINSQNQKVPEDAPVAQKYRTLQRELRCGRVSVRVHIRIMATIP